jgi:hypothetical protein
MGIAFAIVAQSALTYLPFMQATFSTAPVVFADGVMIIAVGVVVLIAVEVEKRIVAWWSEPKPAPAIALGPATASRQTLS